MTMVDSLYLCLFLLARTIQLNKAYTIQNKIIKKAGQIIITIRDVVLIPESDDEFEEP